MIKTFKPANSTEIGLLVFPIPPSMSIVLVSWLELTSSITAFILVGSSLGAFTTPYSPDITISGITKAIFATWYSDLKFKG